MKEKCIIFDGQVFQSAAWDRGMGKYSFSLLLALNVSKEYRYKKTYIIFTKHLPLKNEVKNAIQKAAPGAKFKFLDLKVPNLSGNHNIKPLQSRNEAILDRFIADEVGNQPRPDFIILSLFIDQICAVFPRQARKILLFYDLIPLQYCNRYGQLGNFHNYLARVKTILEADNILTISQTVADDLAVYLGINKRKLCNIEGAAIPRYHEQPQKPEQGFPQKYVLMPSGNDLRKNNLRAVQGFEEYRHRFSDPDIYLLITSFFDEVTMQQLRDVSPHVIFTGNVTEAELNWLYKNTQALLFVSEYEGLGLPILEAAEVDKPVVCSNLTVFNEMSTTAFYYADQHSPAAIAESLNDALLGITIEEKIRQYPAILKRYTWQHSAEKTLQFLNTSSGEEQTQNPKPRLAVFTPNPKGYSAIGKVVMQLHPELSKHFEIDYYVEDGKSNNQFSRPSYLPEVAKVFRATDFNAKRYADYQAVLYHIGNSEYHLETIKNALHLPGYTIIHDTHLKDIFEVAYQYGYIDQSRLSAESNLDDILKTDKTSHLASISNAQLGIITHSHYATQAVEALRLNAVPIQRLNLPTATPELRKQKINHAFSIGFAGIIHKAKGINVIEQVAQSAAFRDASIFIFGIPLVTEETLNRLNSYPNVSIETSMTDFEFQTRLSGMDVIINYRPKYNGETSLTVIEAMRYGAVPFVRNVGWFAELPDTCVCKLENENELISALEVFRSNPQQQEVMAMSARELTDKDFSYEQYAEGIAAFIQSSLRNATVNNRIHEKLKQGGSLRSIKKIIAP